MSVEHYLLLGVGALIIIYVMYFNKRREQQRLNNIWQRKNYENNY
jgi:hypothetical protein